MSYAWMEEVTFERRLRDRVEAEALDRFTEQMGASVVAHVERHVCDWMDCRGEWDHNPNSEGSIAFGLAEAARQNADEADADAAARYTRCYWCEMACEPCVRHTRMALLDGEMWTYIAHLI